MYRHSGGLNKALCDRQVAVKVDSLLLCEVLQS